MSLQTGVLHGASVTADLEHACMCVTLFLELARVVSMWCGHGVVFFSFLVYLDSEECYYRLKCINVGADA